MTAPRSPAAGPKSRKRSSWARIAATFAASVSRSSRFRSADLPDGSPIMPGSAADERDGPAAVALELEQPEDRHEVADVERRPGRIEAVVARDRATAGQPGGKARRRGWSMPRQVSSASSPTRSGAEASHGPSRAAARSRAVRTEEGQLTAPMLSCGPTCRPASRGGSAIGAASDRSRPRGSSAVRKIAVAIPLILLRVLPRRRRRAWSARPRPTTTTARACPTRVDARQPHLRPADRRLRPDRQGGARAARRVQARGRDLRPDPAEMLDATTAIEDKDFWSNPGFDLGGFVSATLDTLSGRPRGGSTITQQLVRARLLPESAFERRPRGAQDPRDHPVDPADRGLPGRGGQAGDHHRLPQPELLRQPVVRDQGGRPELLRQGAGRADPRPGRAPRRDPPVADEVRPREERRGGLQRSTVADGDDCPAAKIQLVVPADVRDRHPAQLRPRPDEDPQPAVGQRVTRSTSTRRPRASRSSSRRSSASAGSPRTSSGRSATSSATILCPDDAVDQCTAIDTGGYRVTTTLDWKMQTTTEKWLYAAARVPNLSRHRRPRA